MKYFLTYLCVLLSTAGHAQVDSLLAEMDQADHDSVRLRLLIEISEVCDIPEIEKYAHQALELSQGLLKAPDANRESFIYYQSTAYNNLGFMHHAYGDLEEAIRMYDKSLKKFEEINDSIGISRSYNNIGMVLKDQGKVLEAMDYLEKAEAISTKIDDDQLLTTVMSNYSTIYVQRGELDKALDYLFKALTAQERLKDDYGKAHSYNTLGSLYHSQKNYNKAIHFVKKAIELREKINDDDGAASSYNNLGLLYDVTKKDSLALKYYLKSLEIRQRSNFEIGVAESYSNLGTYYLDRKQEKIGMDYILKSVQIRETLNDIEGLGNSYQKLAAFHLKAEQLDSALHYGLKSIEMAEQTSFISDVEHSALTLSRIYAARGDYENAYHMHKKHILMRDSAMNLENQHKIVDEQLNFDYSQKRLKDSLEYAKTAEIDRLEKIHQQEKLDKANQRNAAMIVGIILLILAVFLALFAYRNKRNSAQIITKQKEEVEEQKALLEEKNKEITDSINYAKRIQSAILPSIKSLEACFSDSFIFYKPKDIVAGDFYWLQQKEGKTLIAVADCTGHGVPGAMVSVVCNNGLNRAVREYGLTDPGEILTKTREIVIAEFEKSEEEVKDGMDIALCVIEGNTLRYAGANNPLWLVRKDSDQLEEIKADKQPIGKYGHPSPFPSHQIELNQGDRFYIFSDGFADQFGGTKGKKFKAANFKRLLLSIQNETMIRQKELIDEAFENWRGDLEQLDDVCIIGVRL